MKKEIIQNKKNKLYAHLVVFSVVGILGIYALFFNQDGVLGYGKSNQPLIVAICQSSHRTVKINEEVSYLVDVTSKWDPVKFEWFGGVKGDTQNIKVKYTEAGKYVPSVKITDEYGNSVVNNCPRVTVEKDESSEDNEKNNIISDTEHIGTLNLPKNNGLNCNLLLRDYVSENLSNNTAQVVLLQRFLRDGQGADIKLTGIFDEDTIKLVNEFQLKYKKDILDVWVELGYLEDGQTTGSVFSTTRWKINDLSCPDNSPYPVIE